MENIETLFTKYLNSKDEKAAEELLRIFAKALNIPFEFKLQKQNPTFLKFKKSK